MTAMTIASGLLISKITFIPLEMSTKKRPVSAAYFALFVSPFFFSKVKVIVPLVQKVL